MDSNEILTSYNFHNYSNPIYRLYFGKMFSQDLYCWDYNPNVVSDKWDYRKDTSSYWWGFYKAYHKNPPASEKIVDWYYHWTGGSGSPDQQWAYIM